MIAHRFPIGIEKEIFFKKGLLFSKQFDIIRNVKENVCFTRTKESVLLGWETGNPCQVFLPKAAKFLADKLENVYQRTFDDGLPIGMNIKMGGFL